MRIIALAAFLLWYDVILWGYPNWWFSIPMPVATFLNQYNLQGKTIAPFCSHGGGRLEQTILSRLCSAILQCGEAA